jgi:hypothetical protein
MVKGAYKLQSSPTRLQRDGATDLRPQQYKDKATASAELDLALRQWGDQPYKASFCFKLEQAYS